MEQHVFEQLTKRNVSRETFAVLQQFVVLLEKWNKSINLIGKSTVDTIWQRHIIDSAQLLDHIPNDKKLVITDLGSGAGFPGIILAILSNHEIHLVESDKRKAAFLQQASLSIPNKIVIYNERIETLSPWKSDIITSRALAPLPKLIELAYPFYTQTSSCLFLKGVHVEEELSLAKESWDMDVVLYPSATAESSAIVSLRNIKKRG